MPFLLRSCVLVLLLLSLQPRLYGATDDAARYDSLKLDQFMHRWLVLGPIPVSESNSPDEATQKKAFADDLLSSAGGEAAVEAREGGKVELGGKEFTWRRLEAEPDVIDLKAGNEPEQYSVAYAWAEIRMPTATEVLLGVGSDDGVKVWLNGKLIHENWTSRAAQIDTDLVPAKFEEGTNRLLLKIQNMTGPWGFVCRWSGPESQGERLITAARNGDLDTARRLVEHGADVDRRSPGGLNAVQVARMRGHQDMVDFLVSQGADERASLPPPERLVEGLFTNVFNPDGPGAAVLIARNGTVLFEKGFGLVSLEHHVAVTPETRFRIGSITKQFTAAAILKLQEQGKLSIDDKLSKFIPDYPRGNEVTIHHLLTHTSGIHSYTSKPEFMDSVTVGAKPEDHIRSFQSDPYDFDPGQRWSYNNSGYFLLGYIIEKVSGQSYGEYLEKAFFEPLGMTSTGVHEATAILEHEATGYSYANGKFTKSLNWDMSKAGGAGALYSTVRDLFLWNEALFHDRVLSAASLKAAFTPVKTVASDATPPEETGYGYGWSLQKSRGLQEISHGGGLNGFVSYLMRLPQENFTVAVLANCAPSPPGADPGSLSHEIAEFYLAEKMAPRETPAIDGSVSAGALDTLVGRYDYGMAILTVSREGDKAFAQLTGQPRFQIFPRSATNFFWKVTEAEVTFVKNAQGEVTKAIHRQGGQVIEAPKLAEITQATVDPKQYDAYVGRYDYGGGKVILTVTRDGDQIFAQLTGQPKFEILPKSDNEFFWKVVNAQVTFISDADGKVTKAVHEQAGRKFDAPRLE